MPAILTSPSPWVDLPSAFRADVDPSDADDAPTNALLTCMAELQRGRSYLAYCDYRSAVVLYDRYVLARESTDGFIVDGFADCATRIAGAEGITRYAAEVLLNEAIALRDRLPEVLDLLRDGVIAPWQATMAINRTELLEGTSAVRTIDRAIADTIREHPGSWSRKRFRDMLDRLVFRENPDAVRERRKDALDKRGMWTEPREDGTAAITAVMAAEDVRIAAASVATLADSVCRHDRRTRPNDCRTPCSLFCQAPPSHATAHSRTVRQPFPTAQPLRDAPR